MRLTEYVSGGRNPNWELCCGTCAFMSKDKQYTAHGWCRIHNYASVSITGGCQKHSKSPDMAYIARPEET